jgi:hypothetical protein
MTAEALFYEIMWQIEGRGRRLPLPWWVQQYFRDWTDKYDRGLFGSQEDSFASNGLYRYWNMVGVKDRHQECLVGQSGEVEPVYDQYALGFFLYDPATGQAHYPQYPDFSQAQPALTQGWEDGYLPTLVTRWRSPPGHEVTQRVLATTVGPDGKDFALVRFRIHAPVAGLPDLRLVLTVSPAGPTGFRRHDKTGRAVGERRLSVLRYRPAERQVEVNNIWGPTFDTAPQRFGMYGNGGAADATFYLDVNPYEELLAGGGFNGFATATDFAGGYCQGAFAWDVTLPAAGDVFDLEVRLPIGDFRDEGDLAALRAVPADDREAANRAFWAGKLDGSGLQATLPPPVAHLFDLFRICRAALLMLSDDGAIHPGPTIYDSFWIRDSSVEGIACALAGDLNLPERQFGEHYTQPHIFHREPGTIGPVSRFGFFGGEHEEADREWDSNGQALWAFGRFDRIRGAAYGFGAGVFSPYVVEGARWIRDNRDRYGLLHSGWSAEHLGDRNKPHYWDDFWALAGLWESGKLAQRLGAPQAAEIWAIYDDVRRATAASIRWVLEEQRRGGEWQTFIPTGPANVGLLDSTMIGTVAYFHPCRLYMGRKLGQDIDAAARMTLETIWACMMDGGFQHEAAWRTYGPYLTLQLAHAFLLLGDVARMDQCLLWAVGNAAYARVRAAPGDASAWQVVQGAWNEQHCYPVAKDFGVPVTDWWYMGDIPHGWAAAEFMTLLRDMLFFEADEDADPHVHLAPGIPPHWLQGDRTLSVRDAPTIFAVPMGYELRHAADTSTITIAITQPLPADVRYVHRCRLGPVLSVEADGRALPITGQEVHLPAGTQQAVIVHG